MSTIIPFALPDALPAPAGEMNDGAVVSIEGWLQEHPDSRANLARTQFEQEQRDREIQDWEKSERARIAGGASITGWLAEQELFEGYTVADWKAWNQLNRLPDEHYPSTTREIGASMMVSVVLLSSVLQAGTPGARTEVVFSINDERRPFPEDLIAALGLGLQEQEAQKAIVGPENWLG